jgi:hypothetical protein
MYTGEKAVCGDNVEIIAISEIYEVVISVYFIFSESISPR